MFGLGGWGAGAFILSAAVVLWPSSAPMPEPLPSRGQSRAQDYTAITARPLFAKLRRPVSVPVFVPPAKPPRDRDIILKGVFLNGSQMQAFLTSGAEPKGRWLAVKGAIAGWTIVSLNPDEVRLEADGETMTVPMHRTAQSAGVPSPGAAMPIVPRPVSYPNGPNQPTRAGAMVPGRPPSLQEMMGASPLSVFGLGAGPGAKGP